MEFYLNLADDQLKQSGDEPSIGLILCKTKDGLVAEYALRDSTLPIGIAEYKINERLPENIQGELPSIDELEAKIEQDYEELKNPSQKRLDSLRQKIAGLKQPEIKTPFTQEILVGLFDNGLRPLFLELIERFKLFQEDFLSQNYFWGSGGRADILNIEMLGDIWKDEKLLKQNDQLYFCYRFNGLRKGGVNTFDIIFQLYFQMGPYWYGFSFVNYNNQQPFLKNPSHSPLSKDDIKLICDTACDFIIEEMERRVEYISEVSKAK